MSASPPRSVVFTGLGDEPAGEVLWPGVPCALLSEGAAVFCTQGCARSQGACGWAIFAGGNFGEAQGQVPGTQACAVFVQKQRWQVAVSPAGSGFLGYIVLWHTHVSSSRTLPQHSTWVSAARLSIKRSREKQRWFFLGVGTGQGCPPLSCWPGRLPEEPWPQRGRPSWGEELRTGIERAQTALSSRFVLLRVGIHLETCRPG